MQKEEEKLGISAYAYEHDMDFLIDLIDTFRGTGHCEKKWTDAKNPTDREKNVKRFWSR